MDLFDNSIPLAEKKITAEVCIHHLWFSDVDYDKKGNFIKWNPAIKSAKDQEALLKAVLEDKIDVIATDHAPHTLEEKTNKYLSCPSGGPLVQHALVAMFEAHLKGKISVEKIVKKMCHNPAKIFQIEKRGFIKEGYFADLVIVNSHQPWTVKKENILYHCGWSPFEGTNFKSRVTHTFVNGKLVYENGKVKEVKAQFTAQSEEKSGFELINAAFDKILARDPRVFAFGEDVGKIGDVNQGFAGLQEKYGEHRVGDTGIRECTIIGQGIGAALRGLRPIAEIQYLDYFLYAVQILSDDLATLQYRTKGGQKAPLIIRTRGHRLEGVWHSGSPMGMILNSLRGIYILTPRDMTQAAGFYNTMLKSHHPAVIIECLNGYLLK